MIRDGEMSKQEEYRAHAMKLMELACRQPMGPDKNRLLAFADAWLDLAERAARSPTERLRRLVSKDAEEPTQSEAK